jgi:hypothetical protein
MREHRHRVDASVGASGPHDFSVRSSAVRQRAAKASIASRATFRDDRDTPLFEGARWGELLVVICPTTKAEYFFARDWTVDSALIAFMKCDFWRKWIFEVYCRSEPRMASRVCIRKLAPIATDDHNSSSFRDASKMRTTMCNCTSENPFLQIFKWLDGFRVWLHRARIRATRWDHPGMTRIGAAIANSPPRPPTVRTAASSH